MKTTVKYTYETPDEISEIEKFNSVEEFVEKYSMYKQLLSEGRDELNTKIKINVFDYPATITIEIIRNSK